MLDVGVCMGVVVGVFQRLALRNVFLNLSIALLMLRAVIMRKNLVM